MPSPTRSSCAWLIAAAAVVLLIGGCASAPRTELEKDRLHERAQAALEDFRSVDPTLSERLEDAYGYAIFPSVTKGGAGFGGAHGWGEAYEGGELVGYAELTQGSLGAQLGGQSYSELILFEDKATFQDFRHDSVEFAAQASAVAASKGAAAGADYERGVMVFTRTQSGLMFEASIGGQGFDFMPLD